LEVFEKIINLITENFNNRELATYFWMLVLFVYVVRLKSVRDSFFDLLKTLTKLKLLFFSFFAYSFLAVRILFLSGTWNPSMLKQAVYWFFFSGIVLIFMVFKDDFSFKKIIIGSFGVTVIVEFLVNIYVFPFYVEVLLIPITFLFTAFIPILGNMKDSKENLQAIQMSNIILSMIGFLLLFFSVFKIVSDDSFYLGETVFDFLFPVIMTVSFIPYLFLVRILSSYESVFVIGKIFFGENRKMLSFFKWQLIKNFRFDIKSLRDFKPTAMREFTVNSDKDEIVKIIKEFKDNKNDHF